MSQHPSDDPERPYFASAAKGTEGALRDELKELRIARVKATRGGVYFGGSLADAARVCLHSRIAMRVLERQTSVSRAQCDALYDGVHAMSGSACSTRAARCPWTRCCAMRRSRTRSSQRSA